MNIVNFTTNNCFFIPPPSLVHKPQLLKRRCLVSDQQRKFYTLTNFARSKCSFLSAYAPLVSPYKMLGRRRHFKFSRCETLR